MKGKRQGTPDTTRKRQARSLSVRRSARSRQPSRQLASGSEHEGRTKQRGPTLTQPDARLRLQELSVGEGLGPAADKTTGRKRTATTQATRRTQSVAPPRKRGRPARQVAVPEGDLVSDSEDWVDNTSHHDNVTG